MQLIEQKIKALQDEINLWSSVLYPHLTQLRQLEVASYSSYLLGPGGMEDDVSAEFAFESLVSVYGRLSDVVLAGGQLWPQWKEDFELDHPSAYIHSQPNDIIEFLKEIAQSTESRPWVVNLILKRTEHFSEALSEGEEFGPKELFTMVCRWRRALGKAAVLESSYIAVTEKMFGKRDWAELIHERVQGLNFTDKRIFTNAIRRYLASEYIFPWLSDKYSRNVSQYSSLFKLARLEDETMRQYIEQIIHDLFEDGVVVEGAIQQVTEILTRIASTLNQIRDYKELIDQIIYGGGLGGPDSFIGSREPVNIIPANDESGQCREVLLAFAQGRRSPIRGLKAVMRQVREHLIRCQQTQIVIIFTDTWDPGIFAESREDFQAYRSIIPPRTIIGALVNANRITPQAIN